MAKRKRDRRDVAGDDEEDTAMPDLRYGMGAALGAVKGVRSSEISHASPDNGTGGAGWQTVGSRKKQKATFSTSTYPSFTLSPTVRLNHHVQLREFQSLVLYLLADAQAPTFLGVRNASAIKKVVACMIPGLERAMFVGDNEDADVDMGVAGQAKHPDLYYPIALERDHLRDTVKPLAGIFPLLWPILTPADARSSRIFSPIAEILTVPLSKPDKSQVHWREDKKMKPAKHAPNQDSTRDGVGAATQPIPVSELVAALDQLKDENYVLHPSLMHSDAERAELDQNRKKRKQSTSDGWVDSDGAAKSAADSTESSEGASNGYTVLAIDCEMCKTDEDQYELTRICVVDYDGNIIMDELVKPDNPITDYVSHYSGITQELLDPVTTRLSDVQARLSKLLTPQTILIGHSINSDLNALKMTHHLIIDTALIYPHPRGPPLKSSLRYLSEHHLKRKIQTSQKGHDPTEDARAALDLVKLKASRGHDFATPVLHQESIFKRLSRPTSRRKNGATGAVVDWGVPMRGYGAAASVAIGCENDAEVVQGIARVVRGDDDGAAVAGGGVDFVWARMRELEALRGLWNRSSTSDNDELRKRARAQYLKQNEMENESVKLSDASGSILDAAVARTSERIKAIHETLPPCTAFIVYSGGGDVRELSKMQDMYRQFKKEFEFKKWDELSVRWTEVEEEARSKAFKRARQSIAFATVK